METYDDWARRHYTAIGEQKGELVALKRMLKRLLPQAVVDRIGSVEDITQFEAAFLRVHEMTAADDFQL